MSIEKKIQKQLDKQFPGQVHAKLDGKRLILTGEVECWDELVQIGRQCAAPGKYRVVNQIRSRSEAQNPMIVPTTHGKELEGKRFDVVVIGAGVVGCAIARELMRWNIHVALLEKEHDVGLHASSRNDGMVHPGIDLIKGTLKQKYNLWGNRIYDQVCQELHVPFKRTGQLLGFKQKWAKALLPITPIYWKCMGIPCRYVNKQQAIEIEPNISPEVQGGLFFASAGIVCPYGLTIAYAENAVENGAELYLDTAVTGMTVLDGKIEEVHTNKGTLKAKIVVNAAGVFSDEVAAMAEDQTFSIHPRKGTNSILDKKAARAVNRIFSMLGTSDTKKAHTKGGGVVSTIDGNLLVGPDAKEVPDREDFSTSRDSIAATFDKQSRAYPGLESKDIITYFSGIRAATYEEDFVIEQGQNTKNVIHAAGIQSPGLTAAPAIGKDVAGMAVKLLGEVAENPHFNPERKPIPRMTELSKEERDAFIQEHPEFGVIVCRCEEVSKGEILAALNRPVPCDTVDGVKRRVRPGMGRCQGGFCGPLVAKIIAQEKNIPLENVCKNGEGSWIVCGNNKEANEA